MRSQVRLEGGGPFVFVLPPKRQLVGSRAGVLLLPLPFALLLQFSVQVGIGWFLAATYVVFRDLLPILGFLLSVAFYLSPILYPVAGRFERFFIWNPMTPLLGLFRSALLSSAIPGAGSLVFLVAVAAAVFAGGLMFFRRAQPTLADLI